MKRSMGAFVILTGMLGMLGCEDQLKEPDVITPEWVVSVCDDVEHAWPLPSQDEICYRKPDCAITEPGYMGGCPNLCICVCYNEMAFQTTCTALDCSEPNICSGW
jgi:hypothetical protein